MGAISGRSSTASTTSRAYEWRSVSSTVPEENVITGRQVRSSPRKGRTVVVAANSDCQAAEERDPGSSRAATRCPLPSNSTPKSTPATVARPVEQVGEAGQGERATGLVTGQGGRREHREDQVLAVGRTARWAGSAT